MILENNCDDFRKNLHKLWQTDQYCDVSLTDGDGKTRILAHRMVLAASSPYFANRIAHSADCTKEIVVTVIDGITLQRLVDVCYSGTLEVDEDNVSSLYIGAIHLQLNSLLTTMEEYIVTLLNNFNCLHFYHLAYTLSRKVFLNATKNYICAHFVEIGDQPSFLELSAIKLKGLLTLEGLQEASAEDLFHNAIKWIQHDPDRRNDVFPELLPKLRLSSMSPKFLLDHVTPHCKTVETSAFIFAILKTQLESVPPVSTDVKRLSLPVDVGREQLFVVAKGFNMKCGIMVFSFDRQNWITLAELPTRVHSLSVTYSKALNSLCFVGGYLEGSCVNNVLLWNLKTRIFSKSTSMIESRYDPSVISLNDGSDEDGDLIVVGGWNKCFTNLSTVERWSRKSGKWHSLLPVQVESHCARLVIIGNIMYCIGGWCSGYLKSVNCYNLSEKCWSPLAPLNHGRYNFGIMIDSGRIYVIGGGSDVIECYNPIKNKWTEACIALIGKISLNPSIKTRKKD